MFSTLETLLLSYATTLSLPTFVFIASIIEEIVAPIPSPTVMLLAGSFARVQEQTLLMLIPLALIGALGKTLGGLVVYLISDRAEDVVMRRFGHFFNVSHEDVEHFGKRLGKGKRDYAFLTMLRALPFIPSVILSVGSGILKIPLPLFIFSTFFGTIIRDGFYLYAGYVGTVVLSKFIAESTHIETYIEIIGAVVILYFLVRHIYRRKTIISK